MSSLVGYELLKIKNILSSYLQHPAQDFSVNRCWWIKKFHQNMNGLGLRHQLLILSTKRILSSALPQLSIWPVSEVNISSAMNLRCICAQDCELLQGAEVTAHPSLQLSAHIGYCLAHRNYSVKVCRTEMSLSSFSGLSQVITKPPTTLGKQLSLTQKWRMYCNAVWCFTLSHSSGRRDLQTDGRSVYSDYTGQHLTQITATQGV